MRQIGKSVLPALLALSLAACTHATIANTAIPDTGENRAVLEVLAKYKQAVEAKDVDAVMALVAPEYIDVAVPGRAIDSRDYKGLKEALDKQFARTKSIRLEVHPREVRVRGDEANVDYFYVVRYDPVLLTDKGQWRSETNDARLKLSRQKGQWKIVSGL